MDNLNEEEKQRISEEREIKKEEKRRAAEEKHLKEESAARKAAVQNAVISFAKKMSVFSKTAARKTAGTATSSMNRSNDLLRRAKSVIGRIDARYASFYEEAKNRFSVFAQNPLSIPVFIVIALLSYAGITYLCGFRLFGLKVYPPTFQFYLCDYSVGFCSRLFVGAVIALFRDNVTTSLMSLIINVAVCASLFFQAILAGVLLRTALINKSLLATLIALLFLTNPLVVAENMSAPGLLDVYLLLLFLAWLAFLKTPLIAIVTPMFCLLGMAIHYEFLFTFLPPMLTLLLYYALFSEKKRVCVGRWFAFAGGSAVSFSSFVYFVFFAKDHLKMTSEEFYQYLLSRFALTSNEREVYTYLMGAPIFRDYFDFYIFGNYKGTAYFGNMGSFLTFLKDWTYEHFNSVVFRKDMIMFLPAVVFVLVIWGFCLSKEKGVRKLPFLCFIGQVLVLIPALVISTDIWRWVSAALIAQFVVFAVVYTDRKSVLHRVIDNGQKDHRKAAVAAGAFVIYTYLCIQSA